MGIKDARSQGKPTVNDIAHVAGVSLATVDRVLNARPGVRSVTIEKVQRAIDELGYIRDTAAANLARKRVYTLLFILPEAGNEFVLGLERQIAEQAEKLQLDRTLIRVAKFAPHDPQAMVGILDDLSATETDGVAVFGPETPSVRDAVRRARDRGLAVVALVSDLPSSDRDHFVGIDNVAAGRTAGQLMGRFVRGSGRILVVTESRLARDHLERRSGFDAVIREEFPNLEVMPSIACRDDGELHDRILPEAFETYGDVCGIYASATGGPGLIRFVREAGRGKELVVIAHELTPASRAALQARLFDAVISQDTGHLVRSAVRLLKATADRVPFDERQERIRIEIHLKENVPQP